MLVCKPLGKVKVDVIILSYIIKGFSSFNPKGTLLKIISYKIIPKLQ